MTLDVTRLELSPYAMNCYVVRREGADESVVIDPGWPGAADAVTEALHGARCTAILITHADIDHIGGVAELQRATGAPVHMTEGDAERAPRVNEISSGGPPGVQPITPGGPLPGGERAE